MKGQFFQLLLSFVLIFLLTGCSKDESREHFSSYPQQYADRAEFFAKDGIQLINGGYVISGNTGVLGENGDFYAVGAAESLSLLFEKNFGGTGRDRCFGVGELRDGSLVFCGSTDSLTVGSTTDILLYRTDINGNVIWQRTYGGSGNDEGRAVIGTNDGGILLLSSTESYGVTQRSPMIWKLDVNGDTVFTRVYDQTVYTNTVDLIATTDSSYVMLMNQDVGGGDRFRVMKVRENGDVAWGANFNIETRTFANAIDTVGIEGFIVTGISATGGEENSIFLLRIDIAGNEIWQQSLGGQRDDKALAVNHGPNDTYLVTGTSVSYGNVESRPYIIETAGDGQKNWLKNYDRAFAENSVLMAVRSGGGFALGGANPDGGVYLLRTDAEGNLVQ